MKWTESKDQMPPSGLETAMLTNSPWRPTSEIPVGLPRVIEVYLSGGNPYICKVFPDLTRTQYTDKRDLRDTTDATHADLDLRGNIRHFNDGAFTHWRYIEDGKPTHRSDLRLLCG